MGNIKEVAGMIQRLVPDVRVGIGHGQMEGDKLEEVMSNFIDGTYDVLVATTIIESGIDIPNANTIIINEAQNYGLSDLHQLRGRVGRSNKGVLLLVGPALVRVALGFTQTPASPGAIQRFGQRVEHRHTRPRHPWCGNLLGGEQSGFMADIGFETYQKILNEAIHELKQEQFKDMLEQEERNSANFVRETNLETDFEILFPDDYVSSITERIALYRELDGIDNHPDLELYRQRLHDRFGDLPRQVQDLLATKQIQWMAKDIGFEKVVLKGGKMIVFFVGEQTSPFYQSAKFQRVLSFIQQHPTLGRMYEKNETLRMSFAQVERIEEAAAMLQKIQQAGTPVS